LRGFWIQIIKDKTRSGTARSLDDAIVLAQEIGFPCRIRPAFAFSGGEGVANSMEEFKAVAKRALTHSLSCEILVEAVVQEAEKA
jgi:carbamoyl-phosphate synthase large subunit